MKVGKLANPADLNMGYTGSKNRSSGQIKGKLYQATSFFVKMFVLMISRLNLNMDHFRGEIRYHAKSKGNLRNPVDATF